ncbi:hypothetical protein NQ317_015743, partial [Molorchus minor]
CKMNNCESEEIVEAANIAISNLLPTKSRSLYDIAYNRFKSGALRKMFKYTARMFCWHTSVKMQRITTMLDNLRQHRYKQNSDQTDAFLKRTGDGYQAKNRKYWTRVKSTVFYQVQVTKNS